MASGYSINGSSLDDLYVRREFFSEGNLWSWGANEAGQLGNNTAVDRSSPVQTIAWGISWKQVAAGAQVSAAIKNDGTLWLYGRNDLGQLGDNTTVNKSSPVQTISAGTNWKQVACGYQTAAIKTDGTLWMWGSGDSGQIGNNSTLNRSSPVQTISLGTNWRQVSCGLYTTAAIKTDGTLWLWGLNSLGQLGDNSGTNRSSPVTTTGAGGSTWKQIASATQGTAAIKTDGTLWRWGNNQYGQLGDNSTVSKSSPVQTVSAGTNWKQVSLIAAGQATAAIKTDGTLWAWGRNSYGQLGDNTNANKSSPVQTVAGGTTWKQVSGAANFNSVSGIKTDGTLWTWGRSFTGQLGDNTNTSRSSPAQVAGPATTFWKQVSFGDRHAAAISDLN